MKDERRLQGDREEDRRRPHAAAQERGCRQATLAALARAQVAAEAAQEPDEERPAYGDQEVAEKDRVALVDQVGRDLRHRVARIRRCALDAEADEEEDDRNYARE